MFYYSYNVCFEIRFHAGVFSGIGDLTVRFVILDGPMGWFEYEMFLHSTFLVNLFYYVQSLLAIALIKPFGRPYIAGESRDK